ncbi:MAG: class I SAM-dependent methyltransferase [Nanoarchaeota archaeon]|nr:class I SAM-dependent methyltransferase [Nanoarchaeota archaeon]MBU0977850.1 class I SAM-dependent methyltransferase [Nanoarchaeota archaeon]
MTTKPRKPDEESYIYTEGVDYSQTGKTSIWGVGDKDTLELLNKIEISGKWLNLAAGDGRYNLNLLEKAGSVVASDIDESALDKLRQNTPEELRAKLKTEVFDITKQFPFDDESFDGVFCTGTLHLFPTEILRQILSEIDRVLRSKGKLIIDFATDIKRILPDGKLYVRKSEPQYKAEEAAKFLRELFHNYQIQIRESEVPEEEIETRGFVYRFCCKFILLTANKK